MIWEIESGNRVQSSLDLAVSALPISLIFTQNDSVLIGGYSNGRLVAFRTRPKRTPPQNLLGIDSTFFSGKIFGSITELHLSPSGDYILSNKPSLWDYNRLSLVEDLRDMRAWGSNTVAYRGNDHQIVIGNDNGLYLYSMNQEDPELYIEDDYWPEDSFSPDPNVLAVAANSDGSLVAAGDSFNRIKVWEATTGKPLFTGKSRQHADALYFAHDSRSFITVKKGNEYVGGIVELWMLPE